MAFDQDAVDEAERILQPQIDDLKSQVSALTVQIGSLVLTSISPDTVVETYPDGSTVTYVKS